MKILLCIDDTDDKTNKTSTGKIARYIVKNIMYNKYGETNEVTKHQLLLNNEVTYTTSNHSICIEADVIEDLYMEVIKDAEDIIKENMSPESNPGICVIMADKVFNKDEILEFGIKAKSEKIETSEAFSLALRSGLYLKQHGGDGSGVIGALAGASLKLGGNDGEIYDLEEKES